MLSAQDNRSRKLRVALLWLLPVLAAGIIVQSQLRAQPVTVTPVMRGKAIDAVYATGTVEAEGRVEVRAKTSGSVAQLLVREGDTVHEGDLLAVIDNPSATFDHKRGQGELSAARALGAKNSPRLASLSAQTSSLRVQLQAADRELARVRKLHASGSLPQAELERAEAHQEQLLRLLQSNVAERRALRISLSADVARQTSFLHSLEARVSDTQVRAPIDGVILARHIRRGEVLSINQPLFVVADTRALILELWVDEADIASVSQGGAGRAASQVAFSLLAFPNQVFAGQVFEILPEADRTKKAFLTKVRMGSPPRGVRSGMTAEVNIIVQASEGLLAPSASESNQTIWVAAEGRAVRRKVTIGIRDPLLIEVQSGLKAGELVVVEGQAGLSEGGRIEATVRAPDKYQPLPEHAPSAAISL